ncbi:MAG: NIPSNAP family protein [Acidobacteria bacterium]|nr:NIPSNAP family protein [Acidobacteriota bacterium]
MKNSLPDAITILRVAGLVAFVFVAGFWIGQERGKAAASNRVYELRTYYTHDGKLPDLLARFRNHTTKLFEKHGMKNVWYGVPQDPAKAEGPGKENTLIYLLSFESREAAKKSWDGFRNDPQWKQVAAESEKNGKIVKKVESVYLDPTDFSAMK